MESVIIGTNDTIRERGPVGDDPPSHPRSLPIGVSISFFLIFPQKRREECITPKYHVRNGEPGGAHVIPIHFEGGARVDIVEFSHIPA